MPGEDPPCREDRAGQPERATNQRSPDAKEHLCPSDLGCRGMPEKKRDGGQPDSEQQERQPESGVRGGAGRGGYRWPHHVVHQRALETIAGRHLHIGNEPRQLRGIRRSLPSARRMVDRVVEDGSERGDHPALSHQASANLANRQSGGLRAHATERAVGDCVK